MVDHVKVDPIPDIQLLENLQDDWFFRNWLNRLWAKVTGVRSYTATIDPTSVSANSTDEQQFTVTGVTTDDIIVINKPTHTSGLIIGNVRASDTDEISIVFANITGGAIDAASETYDILAIKKDLL